LAKPIVDGLERDLQGKASVMRFNVTSDVGGQAAYIFGVRAVPTLVLVDGEGQPVLTQAGHLRPGEVRAKVDELITDTR
jgi:thioredoxin-like negative regulator of GroEL